MSNETADIRSTGTNADLTLDHAVLIKEVTTEKGSIRIAGN